MVGNPAAWLAQSSENRWAQQSTWRTRIADARKLQSVAEVEAAAAGRRAIGLLNAGWTVDRVAAKLVRAEVNRSQRSKGPTEK